MTDSDRPNAGTPRSTEGDTDPQVTITKWRAYNREKMRVHQRTHIVCWVIALPVAWWAWKTQSYQIVMGWFEMSAVEAQRARPIFEFCTIVGAWMWSVILLAPLRWHLKSRWRVDPDRYGLSSGGGASD